MVKNKTQSSANVEQIREILFGRKINEFEERFKQIDLSITSLEEKLTKTLLTSQRNLELKSERSFQLLEKMIETLAVTNQRERGKLKALIDSNDVTLQGYFVTHKEEFNRKIKILKEYMVDEKKRNEENMLSLERELQLAIKAGILALNEEKLSRDGMAQFLLDMAMKIQGTQMDVLLNQGDSPEN